VLDLSIASTLAICEIAMFLALIVDIAKAPVIALHRQAHLWIVDVRSTAHYHRVK
jgi:hypothetical protein